MEEEMKNILDSEKNKYLKTVAIIYLVLGGIILFGSLIYAISKENLFIFIMGFVMFAVIFFSYLMCSIFYEIHQMNKYLVSNIIEKSLKEQEETKEYIKEQEKNNEAELIELLKKLDK